jgi:hypothetical protein
MSSSENSSVPNELDSDLSSEGQLGMQEDEEGEADFDDEMMSEEGEESMSESEDEKSAAR